MKFLIIFCLAAVSVHAQFDEAAQKEIVDQINNLRSLVANGTYRINEETLPPASDMLKVTWNSTLAASAKNITKSCSTRFGLAPGMGKKYMVRASENSIAKLFLNYWKMSLNRYWNLKNAAQYFVDIQLIWAKSSSVGCAFSPCEVRSQGKKLYKVACLVEKKGNIFDEPVYKGGKACEACPAGTKCASGSLLCA